MLKPLRFIIITGITSACAFASYAQIQSQTQQLESHQSTNKNGYRVVVTQHCKQVLEAPLSDEQVNSYLAMKEQSKKMQSLEYPVNKVSAQMSKLGNQIQTITQQAYMVTDGKLTIDKTLLAQQQAVSAELEQLAAKNKGKFKALEAQSQLLHKAAQHFEALITPTIGDIEHSHVQILAPEEQAQTDCVTRS
ncbi:hypothetical protein [Pseudoalteromonas byunsanensis]|uniref:Uncharacterized protein n=1 Tax=Pseudoalteromonas byunsanensis TaxID=327939 RepID=A0A1S1N5H7_9GAMM|nr:hypothetical protein [Pseudoalteromonas byunsanensis]OHU94566.1 hypothetical protein BIW53_16020 [Pseudoalteromonas byunsanensis]